MNKVIYIGELTLSVALGPEGAARTRVGDRIVGAALLDGLMGVETLFVGEVGADAVGDHIVATLDRAGIHTGSVDRYTEGASPVRIEAPHIPSSSAVLHTSYPAEPVNPVWPRINEGDVVVFGSYMSLDSRNHDRLIEMIKYAKARKAIIVYLPYFATEQVPRTTRVMPEVFDNLEVADIVMASVSDLSTLFPGETPEAAFKDHILFYSRRCLVTDFDNLTMRFFDGQESWTLHCHPAECTGAQWESGAIAGVARALSEGIMDPDDIMAKANETAHSQIAASL